MCLMRSKDLEKDLLKKFKKHSFIYAYKEVRGKKLGNLSSLYYPIQHWTPGRHVSSRAKITLTSKEHTRVNKGFHVFLYRNQIEQDLSLRHIIIKVKCFKKDFIAAGYPEFFNSIKPSQAVFRAVTMCKLSRTKKETKK